MAFRLVNIILKQPVSKYFASKCRSKLKSLATHNTSFQNLRSSSCLNIEDEEEAPMKGDLEEAKDGSKLVECPLQSQLESKVTVHPINLHTGPIGESRRMENVTLLSNERLVASSLQRCVTEKTGGINYPLLAYLLIQKRGISGLRPRPLQEKVSLRVLKQNSCTTNRCSTKISSKYSSGWKDDSENEEDEQVKKKTPTICKASIKKRQKKRRRLTKLEESNCPCPEKPPMADIDVRKLKPSHKYEDPKRICKDVDDVCGNGVSDRADAGRRIQRKHLPEITPGECPCSDSRVEDAPKLVRPKFKRVEEPKRTTCDAHSYCETKPKSDRDDWEYVSSEDCVELDSKEKNGRKPNGKKM